MVVSIKLIEKMVYMVHPTLKVFTQLYLVFIAQHDIAGTKLTGTIKSLYVAIANLEVDKFVHFPLGL